MLRQGSSDELSSHSRSFNNTAPITGRHAPIYSFGGGVKVMAAVKRSRWYEGLLSGHGHCEEVKFCQQQTADHTHSKLCAASKKKKTLLGYSQDF